MFTKSSLAEEFVARPRTMQIRATLDTMLEHVEYGVRRTRRHLRGQIVVIHRDELTMHNLASAEDRALIEIPHSEVSRFLESDA